MLKTKEGIKKWLDSVRIYHYKINDDLTVDVDDSVYISNLGLTEIPVQFGVVEGRFICSYNPLKSLKGCPFVVGGRFEAEHCGLLSLEFSPKKIHSHFYIQDNNITSFKYGPQEVHSEIRFGRNPLQSIDGIEHIKAGQITHHAENINEFIPGLNTFYQKTNKGWLLILNEDDIEEIKKIKNLNDELSLELSINHQASKKIKL